MQNSQAQSATDQNSNLFMMRVLLLLPIGQHLLVFCWISRFLIAMILGKTKKGACPATSSEVAEQAPF